jgi:hypothetical protein
MLWLLNATAVANIAQFAGRFPAEPIDVGNHIPLQRSAQGTTD